MKVRLAERIGFCFGVKRAVRMAEAALAKEKRIYSLGSIIHNRQVVDDLSKRGLKAITSIAGVKKGAILISSHGISPRTVSRITARGLRIIDTTCPFVLNAQKCAARLSSEGYRVVIVGDANHPEVKALIDFAGGRAIVVKDKHQAAALKFPKDARVSVISQTTQSAASFADAVRAIAKKKPKALKAVNTICNDAEVRQQCARRLAGRVDLMLVIGGRNSANTGRLLEVCTKVQRNTRLIETDRELRKAWFNNRVRVVGVASGASTPGRVVQQVVQKIHKKGVV